MANETRGTKKRLSKEVISDSDHEQDPVTTKDDNFGEFELVRTSDPSEVAKRDPLAPHHNADGEMYFELSSKRRVTLIKRNGSHFVDIREYWSKGDDWKPGKKGICLSLEQWRSLLEMVPALNSAIESSQ